MSIRATVSETKSTPVDAMKQLIYASNVSPNFRPEDVESILFKSRKNNKRLGISGILFYTPMYFLQCLEGEDQRVDSLYKKIAVDQRHTSIVPIRDVEIAERSFAEREMTYVPKTLLNDQIHHAYFGNDDFDPYILSHEDCLNFLVELNDALAANYV